MFLDILEQYLDKEFIRNYHFFPKRIQQKKFQLKIPIFSKSDDDAAWWPNSYKKILTSGQLRNIQRYQKYVWLVRAFFLELRTCLSQQCIIFFLEFFWRIESKILDMFYSLKVTPFTLGLFTRGFIFILHEGSSKKDISPEGDGGGYT